MTFRFVKPFTFTEATLTKDEYIQMVKAQKELLKLKSQQRGLKWQATYWRNRAQAAS